MTDIASLPHTQATATELRAGLTAFEQAHLISYMQLADAKASMFLAIASGAVAYIASHYGLGWLRGERFFEHSLLLSCTTLALVLSAAFAIAVIVPRKRQRHTGIFFYHDVARLASPSHYADALIERSDLELFREQAAYCYGLAKICNRKYLLLNISLVFGIAGYAGFLALLLWR
jgi:hypothetical protein